MFFMWLFCLLDPFIPTQIKFLATPLVYIPVFWLYLPVKPKKKQLHKYFAYVCFLF